MQPHNNLIIIIGNGFDLAHGLQTNYTQFSNWLLPIILTKITDSIKNKNSNSFVKDSFYKRLMEYQKRDIILNPHLENEYKILSAISLIKKGHTEELIKLCKTERDLLSLMINSDLIGTLYKEQKENWFDIEKTYFRLLYSTYKNQTSSLASISRDQTINVPKNLNNDLVFLKNKLSTYLSSLTSTKDNSIFQFVRENINPYPHITVIDFNYTETIKKYLHQDESIKIINIHGTLKEKNEVFGYGNDKDSKYIELKNYEDDEYLEHFKTVNYVMDDKYSELLGYIPKSNNFNGDFDVQVIGHSLGTTDKTLLKEVFDNSRCKNISLFKRGDLNNNPSLQHKEWKTLAMALMRIMGSENEFRKKLTNFKHSITFP